MYHHQQQPRAKNRSLDQKREPEKAILMNPTQRALDNIISCQTSLSEVLDLRKGNQWIPPVYQQLQFILLLVEVSLTKTRDFVHHDGSEQDVELAVKITNVTDAIDQKTDELLKILQDVKTTLSVSKWKAMFVSTNISWRQGRVREIMDKIMTYQVLLLRAGAPPLTTGEVADLVEKSGIQMDWRIEEHLTDLKVREIRFYLHGTNVQ